MSDDDGKTLDDYLPRLSIEEMFPRTSKALGAGLIAEMERNGIMRTCEEVERLREAAGAAARRQRHADLMSGYRTWLRAQEAKRRRARFTVIDGDSE